MKETFGMDEELKKELGELSCKIVDAWIEWIKRDDGAVFVKYENGIKERLYTVKTRNKIDAKTLIGMSKIEAIFTMDKLVHTWNPDMWY